ncbi:V-set domain-containing T-cell activation inhibitor 1 [Anabarilius grahami]|uniref:V-set domain-containing T-cell activation inhibitor 1 n=1 Tax=Anabarilius grahami TaxID=495550 RepID=A0A3N0ZAU9_ANAGA|nr:V-set domain-containing T-cell activation inhibitor 1 [Anabarilius grahami]
MGHKRSDVGLSLHWFTGDTRRKEWEVETVEADISGSVDLPCSSIEHEHKLQDINVSWRHNGSEIVYDIINGEDSVEQQHPRYKNRTKTFPDEYRRGNFSIKLHNLTHDDAGEFSCFITYSDELQTVQLIIKGV